MRGVIRSWRFRAANALPAVVLLLVSVWLLAGCSVNSETEGGPAAAAAPTAAAGAVAGVPENALNLGTPVIEATPGSVGESAMASELPGAPVRLQAADSQAVEGSVRGVMFDVSLGRAKYLVVDAGKPGSPELFLLPPAVLKLSRITPEKEAGSATTEEDFAGIEFVLANETLSPEAFTPSQTLKDQASLTPEALDIWQQSGTLPEDWDAAARRYWAAYLLDERMGGSESSNAGPVFYVGSDALVQSGQGADRAELFKSPSWQVRSESGEAIGQVWELLFDPQGSTVFAVLRLPDFRGQDDTSVIVPWKRLVWSAEKQAFTVTASLEMLASAPVFDTEALPDFSVPGWEASWQVYWQEDQSKAAQTEPAVRIGQTLATRLIGTRLHDAAGTEIGVVEDIILGSDGTILYLLLRVDDQLRPVPWMTFDYTDDQLIYIDDTARLVDAPGYPSVTAIDPSQADWDAQIRSYWGLGR